MRTMLIILFAGTVSAAADPVRHVRVAQAKPIYYKAAAAVPVPVPRARPIVVEPRTIDRPAGMP
jgi:hypothetical protein